MTGRAGRAIAAGTRLVYDGPHVQAIVRPGRSEFLLVTFNDRVTRANGRRFWGDALAAKLDLAAVGFMSKRANWFPQEDLARAITAVQEFAAPFAERVGYGYSQGAYAAIRASRPLALTATIAVSPQWSIDRRDIADPRYNGLFDPVLNAGMRIVAADAPANLILLSDHVYRIDRRHRNAIVKACGAARLVHVPFADHRTVQVLQGTATFARLLAVVRSGEPLAPVIADARRTSPVRRATIVQRAIRTGRYAIAEAMLAEERLDPADAADAILTLVRRRQIDLAMNVARRLAERAPAEGHVAAAFAYALASGGRFDEARRSAVTARTLGTDPKIVRIADLAAALCDAPTPG